MSPQVMLLEMALTINRRYYIAHNYAQAKHFSDLFQGQLFPVPNKENLFLVVI